MSRHKYPLEGLRSLRRHRVDERAADVRERARQTLAAESAHAQASAQRAGVQAGIVQVSQAERERLEAGAGRVRDLELEGRWRAGADARLQCAAEREETAEHALKEEAALEVSARRELGQADAGARLVDKHRQAWQSESEAAKERSEEESAAEQWTAQRYPRRG